MVPRTARHRDKRVAKLDGGSARLTRAKPSSALSAAHAVAAPRHDRLHVFVGHVSPTQRGELDAARVEPRPFLRRVPVPRLLDVAGPSVVPVEPVSASPTAARWWGQEPVRWPRVRVSRVLEDAAPLADRGERGSEGAAVVAPHIPVSSLDESRERAPSSAWRVRNDRVRAGVEAGVTGLVPDVDVGEARVGSARVDVQSGDHRASLLASDAAMDAASRNATAASGLHKRHGLCKKRARAIPASVSAGSRYASQR